MTHDKCPKCGAEKLATSMSDAMWVCATRLYGAGFGLPEQLDQSPSCVVRQRDQLAAENAALRERVKRLEEVGGYWMPRDQDAQEAWAKAKEAKQ